MGPRAVLIGVVALATSGCALVGYPSGRGDASDPPSVVPASRATRPPSTDASAARPSTPPSADVDLSGVDWEVPAGVRAPDPGHVYEVFGETYTVLDASDGYDEEGEASWYGDAFDGRPTATGETFDMFGLSAAHRTLPLHTFVEVTNLENGNRVIVRINDRGPFARTDRRIIDVSYGAAQRLDMVEQGIARVRVRTVAPPDGR